MKKKRLEIILEKVVGIEEPNVVLEQYQTPAPIAAEILFNARRTGHIYEKDVLDLGCGSGIFTIGSAWLGANKVVGVDIDQRALITMRENMIETGAPEVISLFLTDVKEFDPGRTFDTCIMNPPFGSQEKGADRPFLERAMELCSTVFTIHMTSTTDFIEKFVKARGGKIVSKEEYRFPIPHMFFFHTKEREDIKVTSFKIDCPK